MSAPGAQRTVPPKSRLSDNEIAVRGFFSSGTPFPDKVA